MTLTTGSGLTINYTGFPATVPAPSSLNNITITTNKVTDNYVNSYEQGFFLNANVSVTLDTAFFTGTPTLTLTQNFTGGPSGQSTSLTFNTSDGTVGNPVFSADTIQAFGTYKQVSNIWSIVQDPINFTFNSTDVTNMGTYYYNDPLVNYSVLVENDPVYYKCQTSGISDVTSSTSGGTFHYPMAITSSTGVTTSNSSYGTTFTVIPTYNNINGSTTGTQQTLITNIDYASNANININKIPDITFNNSIIGCRIYSGSPSTLYLTNNASPYTNYPIHTVPTYLYSSQQYANIIYQNSWDITQTAISFTPATGSPITVDATSELLMARGQYTTPSSIPNAYKNYRTYNYYNSTPKVNGSDYSGVSNTGYRYATFAWNIPIDGGTQGYNYLTFNINGIDTSQVVYQYVPITIGPSYSRLRFYYRFEQLNSPLPTDATSYSSIWSDANNLISGSATNSSVAGLTFGNGNYFGTSNVLPNEIYTGYLYQHSPTFSPTFTTVPEHNTTLTFQVSCPNIAPVRTSNIYVYCRIGLPMNCDFTFSNVTATFTNI
jgi:hypothetical protein